MRDELCATLRTGAHRAIAAALGVLLRHHRALSVGAARGFAVSTLRHHGATLAVLTLAAASALAVFRVALGILAAAGHLAVGLVMVAARAGLGAASVGGWGGLGSALGHHGQSHNERAD